jgi:hypothetical protein
MVMENKGVVGVFRALEFGADMEDIPVTVRLGRLVVLGRVLGFCRVESA